MEAVVAVAAKTKPVKSDSCSMKRPASSLKPPAAAPLPQKKKKNNEPSSASGPVSHSSATDAQLYKQWNAWSGHGPPVDPIMEKVKIRVMVERGKRLIQLRHKDKAVLTLSCHHYGNDRSDRLVEFMKDLFVRGFSKEQLQQLKDSMELA